MAHPDITFQNEGSITIMYGHTPAGKGWIEENIPEDAMTWGRDGIVIEHRYVLAIIEGVLGDGLDIGRV